MMRWREVINRLAVAGMLVALCAAVTACGSAVVHEPAVAPEAESAAALDSTDAAAETEAVAATVDLPASAPEAEPAVALDSTDLAAETEAVAATVDQPAAAPDAEAIVAVVEPAAEVQDAVAVSTSRATQPGKLSLPAAGTPEASLATLAETFVLRTFDTAEGQKVVFVPLAGYEKICPHRMRMASEFN